jgi:hypothetical protein
MAQPTTSGDLLVTQPWAKLFAARCELPVRDFIAVFHGWIQKKRTGELLIDVHDYSHVHHGPGVILVGHGCRYGMDLGEGRIGLVFHRRRDTPRAPAAALADAVGSLLSAAQHLEEDCGGELAFAGDEIAVGFDDRLRAPNDSATAASLMPALAELAGALFGEGGSAAPFGHPQAEPRAAFQARLRGPARPLGDLVDRWGAGTMSAK